MSQQADNCLAGPTRVDRVITIDLPDKRLRFEPELKDTRPFVASEMRSIVASLAAGAALEIDLWPPALFDNNTATTGHDGIDRRIKKAFESSPAAQKLVDQIRVSCKQARLVQDIICLEHVDVEVACGEYGRIKVQGLMSAKLHANGDITFPPAVTA